MTGSAKQSIAPADWIASSLHSLAQTLCVCGVGKGALAPCPPMYCIDENGGHAALCPPYIFAIIQFATSNPAIDATAVTNVPQEMLTTTTAQLQFLSSDIDVNSKVA
jgi:hypothetical protein